MNEFLVSFDNLGKIVTHRVRGYDVTIIDRALVVRSADLRWQHAFNTWIKWERV